MLTRRELLEPLAELRRDQVVVTTMGAVRLWGQLSSHELDFASVDSAMGHAADLALGIALACPDRHVVCLNGDGSMLMSLGTLVTVVDAGVTNLTLVVLQNDCYEITGRQAIPGAPRLDFAALARAAGFRSVFHFDDPRSWKGEAAAVLAAGGPVFVGAHVHPERDGPISRGPGADAPYLESSLATASQRLREALTQS